MYRGGKTNKTNAQVCQKLDSIPKIVDVKTVYKPGQVFQPEYSGAESRQPPQYICCKE